MQKLIYLALVRPFLDSLLLVIHLVADSCSLLCLLVVLIEHAFDIAPDWMRYSVMAMLVMVVGVSLVLSIKNLVVLLLRRKATLT
jgi:hypothetical protein